MKLVVDEPESQALREALEPEADVGSSAVTEVELVRAVRRGAPTRVAAAQEILEGIVVVELTSRIRDRAAALEPLTLRSLDAIHLATALEAEPEVVVTYDERLAGAARAAGLRVEAPA